jgi:hypothetical protein
MRPPAGIARRAPVVRVVCAEIVGVVRTPLFCFLAATATAFVILFARAPGAYVSPLLFAEDRGWTSKLVTHGFWWTALHGRGDYCILGNAALVWLGLRACEWPCGGDVFQLPRCLAVAAYLFLAAAVALPVLLLRRQLPPIFLLAAWLLACLLPLGIHSDSWSGFEILGRVSNVGYVFLFVAFVLVWHRNANVRTVLHAAPVDLGLFVCATTNPLCLAVLPATAWPLLRRLAWERQPLGAVVRDPVVWSLSLLAVAVLAVAGVPSPRSDMSSAASPPVGFDTAVEMAVARGMLYPFVWPVYRHLSAWSTLALAAAAVACGWRFGQPRHRPVYAGGIAILAVVSLVLVCCRGEIGTYLGGYRGTFPDRYFYGQNLVATLVMVVFAADAAERLRGRPRLAWLPAAALAGLAVLAAWREPVWRLSDSQFRLEGHDCFEPNARQAIHERRFVDARWRPDPHGEFVAIVVQRGCSKSLVLPRKAVVRALNLRGAPLTAIPAAKTP